MTLNDLIDVGVLSGTKEHLKPLHMEKQWFKTDSSTVTFIVDEKPALAGIDPYNKLIDRNPEDNLIAVEEKSSPRARKLFLASRLAAARCTSDMRATRE